MRVLFVGMLNTFSVPPLEALFAADLDVVAALISQPPTPQLPPIRRLGAPTRPDALPVVNAAPVHPVVSLARERQTPIYVVSQPDAQETLDVVSRLQPDVACVACFPYRLPTDLLALPPHGFLNVHPSLLPAYRGPHPLFWAFRDGLSQTGVTVHFMDADLDTGDIAAQASLELTDGVSGNEADRLAAGVGGRLLVEVVQTLERGDQTRTVQPPGAGFYNPAPSSDDFVLDTSWTARRAFNFMRATAEWGQPYPVQVEGQRLILRTALSYDDHANLDASYQSTGTDTLIQFTPGVLRAL